MKELWRLLAYGRRYSAQLAVSVVLMAVAGGATGMMALLVGPMLYTLLDPNAAEAPIKLNTTPIFHHYLYLPHPPVFHNIWAVMAFAMLTVFLVKGLCDYWATTWSTTSVSRRSPTCATRFSTKC